MDAKCCDRCGTFYKNYYMKLKKSGHGYNTLKITDEGSGYNITLDLCPNCMGEVQKWIKEGYLLMEQYKEDMESD